MNKIMFGALACAAALAGVAAAPSNDNKVLMTVDGRDVTVSEFEYLYNKNNTQQQTPQSVDEYLQMFIDFKLKVAEAHNAGLDTTQSFVSEFESYRDELAAPYMQASEVEDSLVQAAYAHTLEDVNISHIMLPRTRSVADEAKTRARLDSLRSAIIAGTADWDSVSAQYSIDNSVKHKGGTMGWISGGRLPYVFEDMAYNTAKGEISQPVNSGFGWHIIRVNDRRPSRGQVHVAHILKLTRDMNPAQQAQAKRAIDSIYNVVTTTGADFGEVARVESQDPGSAMRGGELDWFGAGQMVADFDSVAFALADGEISLPFQSSFGWHIVHRLGHRPAPSLDDQRASILNAMKQDERASLPHRRVLDQLATRYGATIDQATMRAALEMVKMHNGLDSAMLAQLKQSTMPFVTVNGEQKTLGQTLNNQVKQRINFAAINEANMVEDFLNSAAHLEIDQEVQQLFMDALYANNAEYANLLNEYHDGILLYEISNQNVWEKATRDTQGLANYFKKHRKQYRWDKPHYKGQIVFADNDSILAEAREYIDENNLAAKPDELVRELRAKFGKNIKVERVLASQGENKIIDYLGFGGDKPASVGRWAHYFDVNAKVVSQPEEYLDALGAVTTDYQNELQEQWVKQLRKKYEVKVDQDVLKTIK